jgi:hypothetical protein
VSKLAGNLTNLVFWERNPTLAGQKLKPNTKEASEWSKILKDEVTPALRANSTEWTVGQLIFFSRHPEIRGHFKDQPKDKQQLLSQEFDDIRKNIVHPWLALQLARGNVNSRTIFVVDNDVFRNLPLETRNRAGEELADQFRFVSGAPMTVIFVDPARFPEEFNLSDAIVTVTNVPPNVHVNNALTQQVNNLNRTIASLGSRRKLPVPTPARLTDRYGFAEMNKFVTAATEGAQVAVPLMSSAVALNELIDYLNEEYIPDVYYKGRATKPNAIPKDSSKWTDAQKEMVGRALGRAMAHEVRHLYVRTPVHAADGLGSAAARLFGKDVIAFSSADRTSIQSAITTLEGQQGARAVAASFAAADRSFDFPF